MPRRPPTQRVFNEITNAAAPDMSASPIKMAPVAAPNMAPVPAPTPVQVACSTMRMTHAPALVPTVGPSHMRMAPAPGPSPMRMAPAPAPSPMRMAPAPVPAPVQEASQPVFGKLSGVGKQRQQATPYHHQANAPNLHWTHEQTADFFNPSYAQEAHRQAAWQQYYAYQAYMQANMTPAQFQQWQLAQYYQQYQHQMAMMMMCEKPVQQKPKRKPRAQSAKNLASDSSEPPAAEASQSPKQYSCTDKTIDLPIEPGHMVEAAVPEVFAPVCEPSPSPTAAAVVETQAPKYDEMSRADVVAMCKERGIKAVGKTVDLIKVRPALRDVCTAHAYKHTCTQRMRAKERESEITRRRCCFCRPWKSVTQRRRRPRRLCQWSRRTFLSSRTSCQSWR
jgi:hypothetical protein